MQFGRCNGSTILDPLRDILIMLDGLLVFLLEAEDFSNCLVSLYTQLFKRQLCLAFVEVKTIDLNGIISIVGIQLSHL